MTKKKFTNKSGEVWEWEETPELLEAVEKLKAVERAAWQREFERLEKEAPDYGVGK